MFVSHLWLSHNRRSEPSSPNDPHMGRWFQPSSHVQRLYGRGGRAPLLLGSWKFLSQTVIFQPQPASFFTPLSLLVRDQLRSPSSSSSISAHFQVDSESNSKKTDKDLRARATRF